MKVLKSLQFIWILSLIVHIKGDCTVAEGDPCDTNLELTDWQRSVLHDTEVGFIISDDFLPDGWYKLKTEGERIDIKMPTASPGAFKCGTVYPIWINATYPVFGEPIKTVTGCVTKPGNPCDEQVDICIKACRTEDGDEFVHYLSATPATYMGYCTDSLLPCEEGLSSRTGFPPCDHKFPTNNEPTLEFVEELQGVSAVCNINTNETMDDIEYFVRWFIDGTFVYDSRNTLKISDEQDICIDSSKCCKAGVATDTPHKCILNRKLGSYIQCEVSLRYNDQESFSPGVRSNNFYAGLTVEPNNTIEFEIGANSDISFDVSATIPIVCREKNSLECIFIGNQIKIKSAVIGDRALTQASCQQVITNDSPATFDIIAAKKMVNYGSTANYIQFVGDDSTFDVASRIWKSRTTNLPTIKVIAKGVKSKFCYGSGDPHYYTFDNWYYHIYGTGDFRFYEHNTLPIKIQVRLKKCGSVSCTCGVAVQVGHTHLIVDRCLNAGNTYTIFKTTHDGAVVKEIRSPTKTKVTTAEIFRDGERTPGTSLRFEYGQYKIYLPTGSIIRISLFGSHFMSVFLTGSWDDFNSVKGLCGNYDNNKENDGQYGSVDDPAYECLTGDDCEVTTHNKVVPFTFYDSWRVPDGENIFNGALNLEHPFEINSYCKCNENGFRCDYCNGYEDATDLGCAEERKRRAIVEDEVDPDDYADVYEFGPPENDPEFEPEVPSFPTPNGLTEEYTVQLCTETLMNSTTYALCLNAINNGSITIGNIIEDCVVDIQVTDDVSVAQQTITSLQEQCELELTTNPLYWEVSENGTLVVPTDILGQLCINECNNKGECINGTCQCYEEFGGSDCSISLAQPPLVFAALGNGICDVRSRPCRSAIVYGENFAENANITCHIQNINISESGITLLPKTSIIAGIFVSPQQVKCLLSEPVVQPNSPGEGVVSSGYLVSISNDGQLISEDMAIFIVYDSVCQVCNASTGECYLKDNSCKINGHCYAEFDVDTQNCCQQCLPELLVDNWSTRQVDVPPTIYTPNPYPAIHQHPITFTFDIEDPENCDLTFSMNSDVENVNLSPSGIFSWIPEKASSNLESAFVVEIQDGCGFLSNVTFVVDVCKCEDGEICAFVNGSTLYECVFYEPSNETTTSNDRTTHMVMTSTNTWSPDTSSSRRVTGDHSTSVDDHTVIFAEKTSSNDQATHTLMTSTDTHSPDRSSRWSTRENSASTEDHITQPSLTDTSTQLVLGHTRPTGDHATHVAETLTGRMVEETQPPSTDASTPLVFGHTKSTGDHATHVAETLTGRTVEETEPPSTDASTRLGLGHTKSTDDYTTHVIEPPTERTILGTQPPSTATRVPWMTNGQTSQVTRAHSTTEALSLQSDTTTSQVTRDHFRTTYDKFTHLSGAPTIKTMLEMQSQFTHTTPVTIVSSISVKDQTTPILGTPTGTTRSLFPPTDQPTHTTGTHTEVKIAVTQTPPTDTSDPPLTNDQTAQYIGTQITPKKTETQSQPSGTSTTRSINYSASAIKTEAPTDYFTKQISISRTDSEMSTVDGLYTVKETTSAKPVISNQHAVSLYLEGNFEQWLTGKYEFPHVIAIAVNSFCRLNAGKCCERTDYKQNIIDSNFTTAENVKLLDEMAKDRIKVVTSVEYRDYSETCSQKIVEKRKRDVISDQRGGSANHNIVPRSTNEYIPSEVLKLSIEQERTRIEEVIQMEVTDVSLYKTSENSGKDESSNSYTIFIVIGVASGGVIMLIVLVLYVKCKTSHQPATVRDNRSISSSSSSTNIELSMSSPGGSIAAVDLFIAQSSREGSRTSTPAWCD